MIEKELRNGLINWYPFEKDASIFYTDGIKMPEQSYDYIVSVSDIERTDDPVNLIRDFMQHLNEKGHLFIATENRMGLRFFCGDRDPYTDRVFDGIEKYKSFPQNERKYYEGRLYDRYEIMTFLEQAGVDSYRGYSILPGLEMPQQIYSWEYLPEENVEIRYTPLYHYPGSVFLNEAGLYDDIINNGMFHHMANAYLVDISNSNVYYEVSTVTTSMDRGHGKATATIIRKDGFVEKKALFPEGISEIDRLIENTAELQKRGIRVVEMKRNDAGDGVIMPYVEAETALGYLRRIFWENKEQFIQEVDRFISYVLRSADANDTAQKSELGTEYKKVFIDMVPLNAFYVDGEFVFFDQEFVIDDYPINVLLTRIIGMVHPFDASAADILPRDYFIKKYGLEDKYPVLLSMGAEYINELRNSCQLQEFHKKHKVDYEIIGKNRQRMDYSSDEYNRLFYNILGDLGDKELYIFGSGLWAKKFIAEYGDRYTIKGAFDNNEAMWGQRINGVEIMSPQKMQGLNRENYKLVICVKRCKPILRKIKEMGIINFALYDPNIEYIAPTPESKTSGLAIDEKANKNLDIAEGTSEKKYDVGYVAGVFDLFHVGHLNILRRAKEHCNYLIVGVVSDEQASKGKLHSPYVNETDRMAIVEACKYVDKVFLISPVSPSSRDVYKKYHFDVQFSGSDYENNPYWLGEQAWLRERGSDLVFFPYTQSTSSTKLKNIIEKKNF